MVKSENAQLKKNLRKIQRKEIWRHRELYLFLLPALLALIIFSYIPMYGVVMAFQDVKIGDAYGQSQWIGLHHFERFFKSNWSTTVIWNTLKLTVLTNLVTWPFPIALALLLHNSNHRRIRKLSQNFTYLPYLLSIVVVVSIINVFCAGETGLINIVLSNMGYERISFFGDPKWVLPLYIISEIWTGTGQGAVVYLGALSAVDEELIEAAKIDGAGKLKRIWHIQVPCIMPTLATMMILKMGSLLSVGVDKMLLLQTDLNMSASEVISTYVYKAGFESSQYGFSTAVGLFTNAVNFITILIVNWIVKKVSDTSII